MGFQAISTGSARKRSPDVRHSERRGRASVATRGAFAAAIAIAAGIALAEAPLLPAEEAFRFGARALDSRTVEVRFAMPDGYYLYRDKLRFSSVPPLGLTVPELPPGQVKQDQFFGKVETYRREVALRLALPDGAPGTRVAIQAESQGCADIGVCYPPNRQQVTLVLPDGNAAPSAFVDANPPPKRWFR